MDRRISRLVRKRRTRVLAFAHLTGWQGLALPRSSLTQANVRPVLCTFPPVAHEVGSDQRAVIAERSKSLFTDTSAAKHLTCTIAVSVPLSGAFTISIAVTTTDEFCLPRPPARCSDEYFFFPPDITIPPGRIALSTAMPDGGSDYLADLTTAPIFDDAVYLSEALNLSESQNEDDLDTQLALSARESGIEDPYRFLCPDAHDISTAVSTMTISSEHRSSMSIHSRETQSTGATSHPSRTSKDNPYMEGPLTLRTPPLTRVSLSSDDYYDAMMSRLRPNARHRTSSSTVSGANSIFSNSSSFLQPTPRKQKRASGLGLFSMFRKDSRCVETQFTWYPPLITRCSTCPSRSHHGHHAKPLTPKLECGHSLSKYAIRVHIEEALDSKEHVAPNCCGKPLPRSVLEIVLTKEEVDIVAPSGQQSPTPSSLRDSGYSEDGVLSLDLPHALDARSHPTGSFVTTPDTPSREVTREDEERLNQALANEAFKTLNVQQKELFQRVSLFESNQRKALSAYHQWSLKRLTSQFETNKAEKTKQVGLQCTFISHVSLLISCSTQLSLNVWTSLKLSLSTTFAKLRPKKLKMSQQP